MIRIKAAVLDSWHPNPSAIYPETDVQLFMFLYAPIATAVAGTGVIAVLALGHVSLTPILLAAAGGAVLAIPVTWRVAREIG